MTGVRSRRRNFMLKRDGEHKFQKLKKELRKIPRDKDGLGELARFEIESQIWEVVEET